MNEVKLSDCFKRQESIKLINDFISHIDYEGLHESFKLLESDHPLHSKVLIMRYCKQMTFKEIGKKLNFTLQNAYKIYEKSLLILFDFIKYIR